jgi:hypothetical protein
MVVDAPHVDRRRHVDPLDSIIEQAVLKDDRNFGDFGSQHLPAPGIRIKLSN